jgi:hypothetical protein
VAVDLTVLVELMNERGERQWIYGSAATVDEVVAWAEDLVNVAEDIHSAEASWTMNNWWAS